MRKPPKRTPRPNAPWRMAEAIKRLEDYLQEEILQETIAGAETDHLELLVRDVHKIAVNTGLRQGSGLDMSQEELSEDTLTNRAWSMVFCMAERGVSGNEIWWGQDFLRARNMLEKTGRNCDPTKVTEND